MQSSQVLAVNLKCQRFVPDVVAITAAVASVVAVAVATAAEAVAAGSGLAVVEE